MRAIVHIGFPKVGSSSLQRFLHANREVLAGQGVRYANDRKPGGLGVGSQWEYALAALSRVGQTLGKADRQLRYGVRSLAEQEARSAPVHAALTQFPARFPEPLAVISSEQFLPWLGDAERIAALDGMFREVFADGVLYVVYLREQVAHVASEYSETIKRGGTAFPYEHVERKLAKLNAHETLARWAQVVGRSNLSVRLLDPETLVGGDLLSDFCSVLGVDPATPGLRRPPRRNAALTAPAVEAMRVLNKRVPQLHPDGGFNPLRRDLLEAVMEITRDDPPFRLTEAQGARIARRAAGSNDELRQAFFPERETLFSTQPDLLAERDLAAVRGRGLEVLAEMLVRLRLEEIAPLAAEDRDRAVATR